MKVISVMQPLGAKPTADEIIDAALRSGHYKVDLRAGTVTGPSGRTLAGCVNKYGYRCIVISFGRRTLKRNVTVHRVIAIAAWGSDAVKGKQVAHLDGNPLNNAVSNLWLPSSNKEHDHYDRAHGKLPGPGCPPKTSWEPCVRCGDPDGPPGDRATPARMDGRRFGFDGRLCQRCYRALWAREDRRKRGLTRKPPPPLPIPFRGIPQSAEVLQ